MTTTIPTYKAERMRTNLNGKLCCETFVHIKLAGTKGIPESSLSGQLYEFFTEDNSHAPVKAKIIDSVHFQLKDTPELISKLSHGISAKDFIQKAFETMPNASPLTEMVAFIYEKVK